MSAMGQPGYEYAVRYKFISPTGAPERWYYPRLNEPTLNCARDMYNNLLPRVIGGFYSELELVERPPLPNWAVVRNVVAGKEEQ